MTGMASLRMSALVIHNDGVDKPSLSKAQLGLVIHCQRRVVGQVLLSADERNMVQKALQAVIPETMFLHEGIESVTTSSPMS